MPVCSRRLFRQRTGWFLKSSSLQQQHDMSTLKDDGNDTIDSSTSSSPSVGRDRQWRGSSSRRQRHHQHDLLSTLLTHCDSTGSSGSLDSTVSTSPANHNNNKTNKKEEEESKNQESHNNNNKKHVRFGSIRVRVYEVIVGDHPCCDCPLALGWNYQDDDNNGNDKTEGHCSHEQSLEDFEEARKHTRTHSSRLHKTTSLERHHRLVEQLEQQRQQEQQQLSGNNDKNDASAVAVSLSMEQAEREIRHQSRHHHRHRDRRIQKAQCEQFFQGAGGGE